MLAPLRQTLLARRPTNRLPLPLTIPGLLAWWDGSDSSTISIGTGISQQTDKSGNSYTRTQATGSKQPTVVSGAQNGLNAIRYTGSSSQLFSLASTINLAGVGYTVLTVCWRGGPTGANVVEILGNSSVTLVYAFEWYSNQIIYTTGTGQQRRTNTTVTSTAYNQISVDMDSAGTTGNIYVNGTLNNKATMDTASTAVMQFDQVGRADGAYMNAEEGETLVYSGVLSTANRQALEAYLKAKWGTP